jgi:signal transduction histidine kinase
LNSDDLIKVLTDNKKEFIKIWFKEVTENIPEYFKKGFDLTKNDFESIFNIYINDLIDSDRPDIFKKMLSVIKNKVNSNYPLSIFGYINTYFMCATRKIFRDIFPESFNVRMNYLENISQKILDAEVSLAQTVEDRINELDNKYREITDGLKHKNKTLVEFIDLATHELQSPLWSILGFTSKLHRNYYAIIKEDGRHCLDRISANVTEMHQLIEDMLTMLMIDHKKMMKKKLFINDLIVDTVRRIKSEIDEDFELIWNSSKYMIIGDPEHLRMVFYQIFKNSAQYVIDDNHGKVYLNVEKANGSSYIVIDDDGIGIEEEYRELVFKPMERLKEKNVIGIGMGLALAKRIIEVHGGTILIEDSSCRGIRVKITLPGNRIIFN